MEVEVTDVRKVRAHSRILVKVNPKLIDGQEGIPDRGLRPVRRRRLRQAGRATCSCVSLLSVGTVIESFRSLGQQGFEKALPGAVRGS